MYSDSGVRWCRCEEQKKIPLFFWKTTEKIDCFLLFLDFFSCCFTKKKRNFKNIWRSHLHHRSDDYVEFLCRINFHEEKNFFFSTAQQQFNLVRLERHLLGGKPQRGITTLAECLARCTGTCLAADFNFRPSTAGQCFFHTSSTACSQMVSKKDCAHYRRTTCCK